MPARAGRGESLGSQCGLGPECGLASPFSRGRRWRLGTTVMVFYEDSGAASKGEFGMDQIYGGSLESLRSRSYFGGQIGRVVVHR